MITELGAKAYPHQKVELKLIKYDTNLLNSGGILSNSKNVRSQNLCTLSNQSMSLSSVYKGLIFSKSKS